MREVVGKIDVIVEDLGIIIGDVIVLWKEIKVLGMVVLQFVFSDNVVNFYFLYNYEFDQVVYFGIYDNDMCVGWWKKVSDVEKQVVRVYFCFEGDVDVYWEFICGVVVFVVCISIVFM